MRPSENLLPRVIAYLLLLGVLILPFPRTAAADSISGLLEYTYLNSTTKTVDISGVTSNTKSYGFEQRYNLAFDKTIYPSLFLDGGGLFEDTMQNSTTDGIKTKTDASRLSPYIDLVLKNPFISSGLGYRRREDTSSTNGKDSPKLIQDMYTANLGWHPSELPSFDIYYTRRYLYDEHRTSNIQTENYTWTSDYRSIKGLELNYNGNYNVLKNKQVNPITLDQTNSETDTLTNSGRIAYSGNLFNNRVLYHSSYSISIQDTKTNGNSIQILSLNQLFATTPNPAATPPTTVTEGQLGTFQTVNLVAPLILPATQNNIGLKFANPTKEVNTLFLSITSVETTDINGKIVKKPPSIESLNKIFINNPTIFSFTIYTSTDDSQGLNWGPPTGIAPTKVTVGLNPTSPGDEVGFIITFPPQTTQYIKVVQTPDKLRPIDISNPPPGIDPNKIVVASIQASREIKFTPGKSVTSSNIGGIYDMNLKALILDSPNLSYDMSYTFTHNKSDQSPLATSYLLNNGLSLAHRLSDILSLTARVTDEFSSDTQSKIRNAVTYNAGLSATPLPTLNNSLVYGGKVEFFEGQTSITNSIYLNNSAELYRGLSLNLGSGYSNATSATGQNSDSVSITVGTDIVPNKNMTLSLGYQDLISHQSGGGQPNKSSFNRSATATATYRPLEAIYLTGGYSVNMQNDRENVTLQNYGVSWSPFRGGDLQFSFAYSQSLNSSSNEKDTYISPSLRWNIRPGSILDVSYNIQDSTSSTTGTTNSDSFRAHLRIAF